MDTAIIHPGERGLGYKPGHEDPRNALFSVAHHLEQRAEAQEEVIERPWRFWNAEGWWGDQGRSSQCTAYSATHFLKDGPVTRPNLIPDPLTLYREFQCEDYWKCRETDDGSTMTAVGRVLHRRGYLVSYHWSKDLWECVKAIIRVGPLLTGIPWYTGFYYPDDTGLIRMQGQIEGYHAICVNGVSRLTSRVRIKNSWGRQWGRNGHCWMSFDDFEKAINDRWAETMLPVEAKERKSE